MLEIHEKKNFEGYEDIINKIGREELRIIESFSNGMVDGYGIYAVYPEQITIYDFDGNDFDIIDGIIRTILSKGSLMANSCDSSSLIMIKIKLPLFEFY